MNLANIVETLKRPGLLGVVGLRAEKRMQQALEAYFGVLGKKIVSLNLEKLSADTTDVLRHSVELRTHNTLRILSPLLKACFETGIHDAMLDTNHIHHMAEASDDPLSEELPLITSDEAALYASIRAGELVTGINQTTQALIADAIQQGIDENLGVQGTSSLLRDALDGMTTYRSRLIASTEMNDAMSEAMLRKLDRIGVEYKQWITATQCCDECAENEDESPIPIDELFSSGDARPPAHPNCRCAISGALAPQAQ